jgi:4-hydroxy-tetrahydrodipicolinate synthase
MNSINLKGVIPAAILPMRADYKPVYDAYERYLEWLIRENAIALSINMDTGEGPQLSIEERRLAIEVAVKIANGRVPVIAGVMGSTTDNAVEMAHVNKEAGAEGLVIFPNAAFRNKPLDPRVPYEYHKAIAEETDLPIVLFQLAPIFGGVLYSRQTLMKLLEIPQVIAIKEASFDAQYFAYTKKTIDLAERPITLLSGNDLFITESFLLGAEGALLGFAAIGCRMVAKMLNHFAGGEYNEGVKMRPQVQGFADFIYGDPILDYRARCKAALAHLDVIDRSQIYVRPPMLQVDDEEYEGLGEALVTAGMLDKAAV